MKRRRSAAIFLPTAYRLLPTAYCLLLTAYCLYRVVSGTGDGEEAFEAAGAEDLVEAGGHVAEGEAAVHGFDAVADVDHETKRGAAHVGDLGEVEDPAGVGLVGEDGGEAFVEAIEFGGVEVVGKEELDDVDGSNDRDFEQLGGHLSDLRLLGRLNHKMEEGAKES